MVVKMVDWKLISNIGGFLAVVNAFFAVLCLAILHDVVLTMSFMTISVIAFIVHLMAWGQDKLNYRGKRW
jgi:hypothetical protein